MIPSLARSLEVAGNKMRSYARAAHGVAPFVARYVLGITFVATGWNALRAGAPGGLVGLIAGGMLLLGILTRLATLPLLVVTLLALVSWHGAFPGDAGLVVILARSEVAYAALLFYLLLGGPGPFAVDRWLAWRVEREAQGRATPEAPSAPRTPPKPVAVRTAPVPESAPTRA
jgi:uncharacterized membrane protein YphA (DoxX/SURF4 family)